MSPNFTLESASATPDTGEVHWKKVAVVGVGLLGGSLGLALRQRKLAGKVVGFVRRPASVTECEQAGAVDSATCDVQAAVAGADLVVLCTPVLQMRALVQQILPGLLPGAIVTDVGSVKGSVVRDLEPLVAKVGAHFIGSHPMAGSEKTGVRAARGDLFQNAICLVTPTSSSDPAAAREAGELWEGVGARVMQMTPEVHDQLVSRSSHLPYVVAASLANLVLGPEHPPEQAVLCATGFRDTTRIASGSPEMWRDIALTNRENLAGALDAFIGGLELFRQALRNGDEQAIAAILTQAKDRRDHWYQRIRPSPAE